MGQSESKPEHRNVPIEQLSHELALRFASRCFSHLEVAHFKDNFKTLADQQDDVEYWKEETLCRFLALPDSMRAGSVLYAMTTYLGAFPFPSLAPCIVTREAMLKVVTILTGRYEKVLKRGNQDRNKLLFRSLAVFDRRTSATLSPDAEKRMKDIIEQQQGDGPDYAMSKEKLQTAATGFSIDQPANDEEDEDDDDLALAALDALDAIEVFKEDQSKDRKIHHAHIPVYNIERLLMLLLLFAPLTPQDNIAATCGAISDVQVAALERSAKSIIAAFEPDHDTISYSSFVRTMTALTPQLFRPLNPLFEHFLFSRHLDLNKHRQAASTPQTDERRSPLCDVEDRSSIILNDVLLAQLSMSIEIAATKSPASSSLFHCGARFNQLYSTASHGTSLSSFSRQVMSWRSASIFVLKGSNVENGQAYTIGAYLPEHWKEAGSASPDRDSIDTPVKAVMFQLHPRQAIFRANPYNKTTPTSHFSSKTGIALGCVIPASSRINAASQQPILGPVSILVDENIETATFQHDGEAGTGAFLTDPLLEESQHRDKTAQAKKIEIEIDGLEVWGVSFPDGEGEDEITKQKKRLAWEDEEAARRKGVNFGGDKDGARHLLEMAGIVGDAANSRSGGSV